ncbi:MAG: M14 family metallopeptidase [Lachnospiraceae bacterium]|nr:M14 family metallopeptidase [Lachnospiraceae bacterium]
MIETICSIELPVGENLQIKKNRITCENATGKEGRIVIVSGIHGDELEGQYVCYEMTRRLKEHPEYLKGIVDLYPAVNPLGMDLAQRNVPKLEMDMNRIFPGSTEGAVMERAAAALVDDIVGADICIDVHASDKFVKEIPQVRVSEDFAKRLLPFAKLMNVDMIWLNATATVHESTLAHTMNMLGVPTLVVEMGLGTRINRSYGNQVVDGIFYLMREMGLWSGPVTEVKQPLVSTDGEVEFIRAGHSGIFLPSIEHHHRIRKGDKIGEIIDVLTGTVTQEIVAQKDGLVFTLREYPFVYEGALLARILTGIKGGFERCL